jgi:hypothetical protein
MPVPTILSYLILDEATVALGDTGNARKELARGRPHG